MSGGGGSSTPDHTTTTTVQEVPEWMKGYVQTSMKRADNLSKNPYQAYTGNRVAGLTDDHYDALGMVRNRALQGSPAIQSAENMAANTFNDYYLNQGMGVAGTANKYAGENPYMQSQIDSAMGDVTKHYNNVINPQLAAMDRNSGAFGNSGVAETRVNSQGELARELGNVSNNMRSQNYYNSANLEQQRLNNTLGAYMNERNAQQGAMEFAPELAGQPYLDAQNLLGVGDILRQQQQTGYDVAYNDWLERQQYPYKMLDLYQNAVRTGMGSGSTNITSAPNPYAANQTANMIGMGLTGYGALQGLMS